MGDIDVFATPEDIILSKGDNTLWCNRKNGELIPKPGRLCNMKVDYELEGKPLISVVYIYRANDLTVYIELCSFIRL